MPEDWCFLRLMKTLALLCISLFSLVASARTKVAFLEVYDSRGQLVQYEPGSRFGHSALQVGDKWLQSYPKEGVQLITWQELQHRGRVAAILEIPVDISLADVQPYLNHPFDYWYSWDDTAFYCSELLAKVLGIPPEPMQFNHKVWPPAYWPLEGKPGITPDKIYPILRGPGPYL